MEDFASGTVGASKTPAHMLSSTRLVLIADDYADAREMIGIALELAGFQTAFAENGAEAIERAMMLRPRAIVMDLSMPVLDGLSAAAVLKKDERTHHIPIVVVSGQGGDIAKRASEMCDGFFTKPCALDQLAEFLERAIARASGEASAG